ncbi:MAG: hypothetical protein ACXAD7_06705 [Candidatus Kariarchaeaceae archaeon]
MSKKAQVKNKNIRLTHEAWHQLRLIKFEKGLPTYSDVFKMLFDKLEGEPNISEQVDSKIPKDTGTVDDQKDKTIVINEEMHAKLASFKVKFMMDKRLTSRGPGAVSISDVVMAIIKQTAE